jgi:hypothetical protein
MVIWANPWDKGYAGAASGFAVYRFPDRIILSTSNTGKKNDQHGDDSLHD